MAKKIKLIISDINNTLLVEKQNGEVRVYLEQKELLLTPKQYEQVFEKLEEIKEVINEKPQTRFIA